MNIMLVAVTERTREIGLRKALGARRARVLMQFVIEAVLLASFGGVIGVAPRLRRDLPRAASSASPPRCRCGRSRSASACRAASASSAGIYPAWRASRLDPAVALRDE